MNKSIKILVTGASGFIGHTLCPALSDAGYNVCACLRRKEKNLSLNYNVLEIDDIGPNTDWQTALTGADVVIHLAARVHILNDRSKDPLKNFRKVNVQGTEHLARMAAKAGVKKFIFISSVKVNGEGSLRPYKETDVPQPEDAYGLSKTEAENALKAIALQTGLPTVILRLPLVYGPGVKANFKNLIKLASLGLPLPFKNICNQRSFLYLGNLIDAIKTCITHPLAAGETFLVSDAQDISTPGLMRLIASAMNKKIVLFSFPPSILNTLGLLTGQSQTIKKLTDTLCVDSSKIQNLLGWKPPFSLDEAIAETVKYSQP